MSTDSVSAQDPAHVFNDPSTARPKVERGPHSWAVQAAAGATFILALAAAATWIGTDHWQAAHQDVIANDATVVMDTSSVGAGIPGTVKQVLVKPGDTVRQGQVLAMLDDANLKAAVAADTSALDAAQKEAQATTAAVLPPPVIGALPRAPLPKAVKAPKALPEPLKPASAAADVTRKAHAASLVRQIEAARELASDHVKAAQTDLAAATQEDEAAKAPLEGLQSNLDMAKAQVEKFQELYNQGIVSRVEFQTKQADADAAQAAVDQAQKQIADADNTVKQRQAEVDASQKNLQALTKQLQDEQKLYQSIKVDTPGPDQDPYPVQPMPEIPLKAVPLGPPMGLAPARVAFPQQLHQISQAKVGAAQAALAKDLARLEAAKIVAKADGLVVAVHVLAGQTVTSGQPLVTLGKPGTTRIVALVPHPEALRVRRGQRCTLILPGVPAAQVAGIVYGFVQGGNATTPAKIEVRPIGAANLANGQLVSVRMHTE